MGSVRSVYSQLVEIDTSSGSLNKVVFTASGEYLLSYNEGAGVQVWRVKDGERVATIPVLSRVRSLAVSKDGKYIAVGSIYYEHGFVDSYRGEVSVWDATTYKQIWAEKLKDVWTVHFSPDSARLGVATGARTADIWDVVSRQIVQTLDHGFLQSARTARFSPQGHRIVTRTKDDVRIWDTKDGHLVLRISNARNPVWSDRHLFVITDRRVKQLDPSTGSTVSEWSVPGFTDGFYIALPRHGRFIACYSSRTVTFWDTSTHTKLGFITRTPYKQFLITFSPDDHLLAVGGGKIVIRGTSFITEPKIQVDGAALDAWKHGQLANAESLLTGAILASTSTLHHVLASRALVRARLQHWDVALVDAEKSINTQLSVVGYIAKCMALVGKGETHKGIRVCDIAFQRFPDDATLLLLIKAIILFMAGEHNDAIARMGDLIDAACFDPTFYIVQAYMYFLLGNLHMDGGKYEHAMQSFEHAQAKLGDHEEQPLLIVSLISGWNFDNLAITIQQRYCEALFAAGRTKRASDSILRMMNCEVDLSEPVKTWVPDFMERCLSAPGNNGDALMSLETASHPLMRLLREWAKSRLKTGLWKHALAAADLFTLPRSTIYQVICERLKRNGRVADAVACFHQMSRELAQEMDGHQRTWTLDFISQCQGELEGLGDIAMDAKEYDEAVSQYTVAMSLSPSAVKDLLAKRSRASAEKGEWEAALNDADEVVGLDPSSPMGYERRHAALHGMRRHDDAVHAFKTMILKMSQSSDPEIRKRSRHYVTPEQTEAAIRATIEKTIRDSPLVLIDTKFGLLCNKSEQAFAFEMTPAFTTLISSMTTNIDNASIKREVRKFYRYATLSHKWEEGEPLYERIIKIAVYDLEASPTHEKLRMFCRIVREAGFNWAWSDTCCINKADHFVLQEALISMFKWYEGSAMTIIFLRGVGRLAKRGALMRSLWNMRAWTLQEYHASKVVRFYTEDWTPYLGIDLYNHKDCPEIISEMEEAMGISAPALMAIRPGMDNIREKLRLASTRQTTRVEDAAYSLLGIFSISLPILYGEGDKALGLLLAQLVTSSGDVSILAWTGRPGSFNTCLPSSISVFSQHPASHIPPAIPDADMGTITARLHSLNIDLVTRLYDLLSGLPVLSFSGRRMKLPGLSFKLGPVSVTQTSSGQVFRAQANVLGVVEIDTPEDLSQLGALYLVHPWIDFLLDRTPIGNSAETVREEGTNDQSSVLGELPSFPGPSNVDSTIRPTRTARLMSRIGRQFGGRSAPDAPSLPPPSTLSPKERQTRVLQFVARLGRPFGALLLTPTRWNVGEYRRVASGSLIRVQMEAMTPAALDKLIHGVRMLDVL